MLPCSIWRYERARRKELLCGSRWLSIGVWSSMTPLPVPKRSHVHWMILCWSLPHNVWKSGSIELAASRTQAPVLMPAYLNLWSQTSPIPTADPEVGLFLHGAERTPAEVSFVWRSDISSSDLSDHQGADRLKALMELVPPRAAEMIEVPLWSATRWLRSEQADATRLARVADAPGRDESDAFEDHGHEKRERFLDVLSSDTATESIDEDTDARRVRSIREPLEALRRAKGRIALHFPYAGDRRGGVAFLPPVRSGPSALSVAAGPGSTTSDTTAQRCRSREERDLGGGLSARSVVHALDTP